MNVTMHGSTNGRESTQRHARLYSTDMCMVSIMYIKSEIQAICKNPQSHHRAWALYFIIVTKFKTSADLEALGTNARARRTDIASVPPSTRTGVYK